MGLSDKFFSTLRNCVLGKVLNSSTNEKELSDKSDFNDFTPAGMNSGRGDFRFSGPVGQPHVAEPHRIGLLGRAAPFPDGRRRSNAGGIRPSRFCFRIAGPGGLRPHLRHRTLPLGRLPSPRSTGVRGGPGAAPQPPGDSHCRERPPAAGPALCRRWAEHATPFRTPLSEAPGGCRCRPDRRRRRRASTGRVFRAAPPRTKRPSSGCG